MNTWVTQLYLNNGFFLRSKVLLHIFFQSPQHHGLENLSHKQADRNVKMWDRWTELYICKTGRQPCSHVTQTALYIQLNSEKKILRYGKIAFSCQNHTGKQVYITLSVSHSCYTNSLSVFPLISHIHLPSYHTYHHYANSLFPLLSE